MAAVENVDHVGNELRGDWRENEEHSDESTDSQKVGAADVTVLAEVVEHRQQHHAENVIQHRGAENNLALDAMASAQVCQHADRDADTGRGQRASDHERRKQLEIESVVAHGKAKHEWQHESADCDDQRLAAGVDQAVQVGVEAHLEQQHDHADLGEHLESLPGFDPAEQARPQEHAGQQFADDGGQTAYQRQFSEDTCGDENQG